MVWGRALGRPQDNVVVNSTQNTMSSTTNNTITNTLNRTRIRLMDTDNNKVDKRTERKFIRIIHAHPTLQAFLSSEFRPASFFCLGTSMNVVLSNNEPEMDRQ